MFPHSLRPLDCTTGFKRFAFDMRGSPLQCMARMVSFRQNYNSYFLTRLLLASPTLPPPGEEGAILDGLLGVGTARSGRRLTVEIQREIVGQVILAHAYVGTEGLAVGEHDLRIVMVENGVSLRVGDAEKIDRNPTCTDVVHLTHHPLDGKQIVAKIDIES